MKAEHRKELETNLLADRMGRLVQRIKTRPQRRSILIVFLVLVLAVTGLVWSIAHRGNQAELEQRWFALESGGPAVNILAGYQVDETKGTISRVPSEFDNPGISGRLEVARYFMWELGVKKLATPGRDAMDAISMAADLYKTLAPEVEDAPEWKAEVLYGLAIIEETNAVRDSKRLTKAIDKYKTLAADLPKTGHGKLAEKRHKEIEANLAEVTDFYEKLGRRLHIPPERAPGGLPVPKAKAK